MKSPQNIYVHYGVLFKWLKDRLAARRQLMLGFWWDSIARTRTLEERRFTQYMEMLVEFGSSRSLSLKQRQVVIGRMTRAMMTLPDGAKCLMGEMLRLARGLKLPWQMRRTTRRERLDYKALHSYLEQNMGKTKLDMLVAVKLLLPSWLVSMSGACDLHD